MATGEEPATHAACELWCSIGIDADEVDVVGRPSIPTLGEAVLLAARRFGIGKRRRGNAGVVERVDHQPRGLSDAEFRAQIPCNVDARFELVRAREAPRFGRCHQRRQQRRRYLLLCDAVAVQPGAKPVGVLTADVRERELQVWPLEIERVEVARDPARPGRRRLVQPLDEAFDRVS